MTKRSWEKNTSAWVVVRYNDYPESGDITVYGPFPSEAEADKHAGIVGSAQVEPLEPPDPSTDHYVMKRNPS